MRRTSSPGSGGRVRRRGPACGPEAVARVADALVASLSGPVDVLGHRLVVGASAGWATQAGPVAGARPPARRGRRDVRAQAQSARRCDPARLHLRAAGADGPDVTSASSAARAARRRFRRPATWLLAMSLPVGVVAGGASAQAAPAFAYSMTSLVSVRHGRRGERVAVAADGTVYFSDAGDGTVKTIDAHGVATVVAATSGKLTKPARPGVRCRRLALHRRPGLGPGVQADGGALSVVAGNGSEGAAVVGSPRRTRRSRTRPEWPSTRRGTSSSRTPGTTRSRGSTPRASSRSSPEPVSRGRPGR